MAGRKSSVDFRLKGAFDLSAFVTSLKHAGWQGRRGRVRVTTGASLDTRARALAEAGLVAFEEGTRSSRKLEIWAVPIKDDSTPARLLFSGRLAASASVEDTVLQATGLAVPEQVSAVAHFRRDVLPLEFSSDAGRVRVSMETVRADDIRSGAFLRMEVLRGGSGALSLVSGLARLHPGVGAKAVDGPSRLMEILGMKSGPAEIDSVRLMKTTSASEAALAIISANWQRALSNESGARLGYDDEFVHDMRVATRRIREALRMFAPVFSSGSAGALTKSIKWLASTLGAVRDLDVYTAKVPGYLAYVTWTPPDYDFFIAGLAKDRAAARKALNAALSSPGYERLKRDMERFLSEPPLSGAGAKPLKSLARKRLKPMISRAVKAADESRTDEELHSARIDFKRLRYAAEFLRALAPGDMKRLARQSSLYQDILGRHQDAAVACGRVEEAMRERGRTRLESFLLGYLLACQRLAAIEARNEFLKKWHGKGAKEFASLAAAAVKRI